MSFKVFIHLAYDTDDMGNAKYAYSHVLLKDEVNNRYCAVGFNGNDGTLFASEEEATAAAREYQASSLVNRFVNYKIC